MNYSPIAPDTTKGCPSKFFVFFKFCLGNSYKTYLSPKTNVGFQQHSNEKHLHACHRSGRFLNYSNSSKSFYGLTWLCLPLPHISNIESNLMRKGTKTQCWLCLSIYPASTHCTVCQSGSALQSVGHLMTLLVKCISSKKLSLGHLSAVQLFRYDPH